MCLQIMVANIGVFVTSKCGFVMGAVNYVPGMYRQESRHGIDSCIYRQWY